MDSILTSIKKVLGIPEEYTHFDVDIIMHINSVLCTLTQIGVGPSDGFTIEDDGATWDEFIPSNYNLALIKSYVGIKVRMLFDPPQSSSVMESLNRIATEYEWRISVTVDPGKEDSQNGE